MAVENKAPFARVIAWMNKEVPRWLRYLYYLRFSILLWWIPLLLVWANGPNQARSLTSGIITPSRQIQYLCVAFFLASASLVALILARIVVINGQERFGDAPPQALKWLMVRNNRGQEWIAPVVSQINNVIVFWYFLSNGKDEGIDPGLIATGLGAGTLVAFLFWLAVNAIYYLTFQPAPEAGSTARTLMFPRKLLMLSSGGAGTSFGDVLEQAKTTISLKWLARIFPVVGYRWPPDGDLFEGHQFSILSACGFFALYFVLWPLTAPVPIAGASNLALILYLLGSLAVILLVLSAKPGKAADLPRLRAWKAIISAAIVIFFFPIPLFYFNADAQRFPTLALVLILVISSIWALGAIAFFADRFRVPVLTVLVVLVVIPRALHRDAGTEEHYLSTALRPAQVTLPTPADILNSRLDKDEDQPVIVVTSTGGGIHAAAWTTAVLEQLEARFSEDPSLKSFHDHVLLLSTVSGGSAGLYPYLRELDARVNDGKPDWERMKQAARCSSLEAIGWGLVYRDIPKAFVPLIPYFWSRSTGVDDLGQSPLSKDRTWALRKAFARNLSDPYCRLDGNSTTLTPLQALQEAQQRNKQNEQELTLGNLDPLSGSFPAFSMNTTAVENGERFLLANYQVPTHVPDLLNPQPAESFLQVFGGVQFDNGDGMRSTDLPLATGAQLSATFPYVSSAAGFPAVKGKQSMHFVDGGYYDNDGTTTAIEFLRNALDGVSPAHEKASIKVLLIEIRNSSASVSTSQSTYAWTNQDPKDGAKPWNLLDQLLAPLDAFWSAGHESVTGRSRIQLDLLKSAYGARPKNKLVLQHIVIQDQHDSVPNKCSGNDLKTDPLNWSLTPAQLCEVEQSATQPSHEQEYTQARDWFVANTDPPAPSQHK